MNSAYRTLFAGMLAIVFTGSALAHQAVDSAWTGGVSLAVLPSGQVSWSGGLAFGSVVAQPAYRAVVPVPQRVPVCGHPSHRHYPGHRKARGHGKKHHGVYGRH